MTKVKYTTTKQVEVSFKKNEKLTNEDTLVVNFYLDGELNGTLHLSEDFEVIKGALFSSKHKHLIDELLTPQTLASFEDLRTIMDDYLIEEEHTVVIDSLNPLILLATPCNKEIKFTGVTHYTFKQRLGLNEHQTVEIEPKDYPLYNFLGIEVGSDTNCATIFVSLV